MERVVCQDIRTDPRWSALQDIAAGAGLQACWSEPILGADGAVLGSFANYRDRPSAPSPADIESIVDAAHIASIAIERKRSSTPCTKATCCCRPSRAPWRPPWNAWSRA